MPFFLFFLLGPVEPIEYRNTFFSLGVSVPLPSRGVAFFCNMDNNDPPRVTVFDRCGCTLVDCSPPPPPLPLLLVPHVDGEVVDDHAVYVGGVEAERLLGLGLGLGVQGEARTVSGKLSGVC